MVREYQDHDRTSGDPDFQNHGEGIEKVINCDEGSLLYIHGAAGIGKTELLKECKARVRQKHDEAIVICVDFTKLNAESASELLENTLRIVVQQARQFPISVAAGWPQDIRPPSEVVKNLRKCANAAPVWLIYDAADHLQEKLNNVPQYCTMLERDLVRPLTQETKVRQVMAGRKKNFVPWSLKTKLKRTPYELKGLQPQDARKLAEKKLALYMANPSPSDAAVSLIVDTAHGNPQLICESAHFLSQHVALLSAQDEARERLYREVVETFVNRAIFRRIDAPWPEILWNVSVLDDFTDDILVRFLLELSSRQPASDIAQLNWSDPTNEPLCRYNVSKLVNLGLLQWESTYKFASGIHHLIRDCLKMGSPQQHQHACNAAASMYSHLSTETKREDPNIAKDLAELARKFGGATV